MYKKKILAMLVVTALVCSGCGAAGKGTEAAQETEVTQQALTETSAVTEEMLEGASEEVAAETVEGKAAGSDVPEGLEDIIPKETVTLDVYTQLTDYQGEQEGWFAQVLLEKFNVKLNFINDGSEELFDRLAAKGDLGDFMLFGTDTDQYQYAISNGLLLDWEKDNLLNEYGSYIAENMQKAIEKNRKTSGGHVYGFGYDVAYEAGEFGDFDYHPDIRWDLYEQIGSPEIVELEDYVDVLKQMKEICPTSDTGEETYGVSLFSDWDGDMMMFAKPTCTNFFGVDEFGVGLYDVDNGSFQGCLEDDGYYIRVLRFYNELYRNGLVDPESRTQGYDGCVADYQSGGAFFCIFGWLAAPQYNTVVHVADGKMMLPKAADNQDTLVYGLNVNGGNRLWTIGSKTEYPELVMSIMNWMCTPEGRLTVEYGPKGVCWDYDTNKNICFIDYGTEMPENSGYSGTFADGAPRFNNTTWAINTRNPESNGQTYNSTYWPNVSGKAVSSIEERWQEANEAETTKEYLSKFTYSVSKPNTYTASSKSEELGIKWGAVTECIRDGSWNAIFAETEGEFETIVDRMQQQAIEAGYEECVAWCEAEAALRKAAEE